MTGSCREQKRNYSRSYRFHQKQYITELEAERYMPAVTRYTWHHMHPHPLPTRNNVKCVATLPYCVRARRVQLRMLVYQLQVANGGSAQPPPQGASSALPNGVPYFCAHFERQRMPPAVGSPNGARCILIAAPGTGRC
jgi:hypothetical protein